MSRKSLFTVFLFHILYYIRALTLRFTIWQKLAYSPSFAPLKNVVLFYINLEKCCPHIPGQHFLTICFVVVIHRGGIFIRLPTFVEHEGKRYANTNTFETVWGIRANVIAKYCLAGLLPDAIKIGYYWYIPIDSIKPLPADQIRQILILTLQLKNTPWHPINYSHMDMQIEDLVKAYNYLVKIEYLHPFDGIPNEKVPYEVELTQKGMELAINLPKGEPISTNIDTLLNTCKPFFLQLITDWSAQLLEAS